MDKHYDAHDDLNKLNYFIKDEDIFKIEDVFKNNLPKDFCKDTFNKKRYDLSLLNEYNNNF